MCRHSIIETFAATCVGFSADGWGFRCIRDQTLESVYWWDVPNSCPDERHWKFVPHCCRTFLPLKQPTERNINTSLYTFRLLFVKIFPAYGFLFFFFLSWIHWHLPLWVQTVYAFVICATCHHMCTCVQRHVHLKNQPVPRGRRWTVQTPFFLHTVQPFWLNTGCIRVQNVCSSWIMLRSQQTCDAKFKNTANLGSSMCF